MLIHSTPVVYRRRAWVGRSGWARPALSMVGREPGGFGGSVDFTKGTRENYLSNEIEVTGIVDALFSL